MNIEPKPSAQMPIGKARNVAGAPEGACEFFEGGGVMRDMIAGGQAAWFGDVRWTRLSFGRCVCTVL